MEIIRVVYKSKPKGSQSILEAFGYLMGELRTKSKKQPNASGVFSSYIFRDKPGKRLES
jgi:hypothetical protein